MPKLVLPSIKYKQSFLRDFLPYVGKSRMKYESWGKYLDPKLLKADFLGFLNFIDEQRKGKNLPEGYIPQTVFWLVDENKLLGILSLRHKLTPHLKKIGGHIGYEVTPKYRGRGYGRLILKLGLKKADAMGIKNVLITCDIDNIPSKKVIESNGGKFASKVNMGIGKPEKLRYWIRI
jgi:predicted acetyltransferase